MKKKRITLKDIAKEFNVSIATVSKALNDSYEISNRTKSMIQEYANELQYKSNQSNFTYEKQKNTKTIGVIIPNMLNHFFTKVFVGIEKITTEKGYNLITCISNESREKEVTAMELLKNSDLDGFILSIAEETQVKKDFNHFKNAIDQGIPIVMIDRVTDEIECDKVIVNDDEGAFNAVNYFIKTGCRNIAIVSNIHQLSVGKHRLEGYKRALIEANIPIDEDLILKVDEFNDIDTLLKIVLDAKKVDAILCLEEDSAISTLKMVLYKGYKVPEDISIIGFTNGVLPRHVTPAITTISQHSTYLGEAAAKILIDKIENENIETSYTTKVIKTNLIERDSTKRLH
ncbi:LacI family DNA-binding transcriptional regulator [Aquimarina sp. MMG015]|uniref:LacI family DNA-binding transcriptional regulator n=1 Tax=Aquimarina TaxID=290174 RepID=UPI000419FB84|nr:MULTISPECIES: LacI family DNA-binding transcriptional regulator [Aquimarina]AXT57201.1 LacI family transcriptional regulator [Aquimarina sp. AD1]MBQ4801568.1 LacI family DNA-binding transcriptional regulator [Aquimarina sp. MMG015]RKN08842.1 LacI family transcriptional regulator [Aquimarina sp. AD1]